jgi:predicted porin
VSVRASNDIGYFAPANLGGFYGQINYWMGENVQTGAATQHDGNGYGLRAGYAAGPFNVAAGYAKTRYAAGDFRTWNLGGQWDFGIARVMAQFGKDRVSSPTNVDGRQWLLGASVPVGPGEIRASYSSYRVNLNAGVPNPRANKFALGYVHNLSKRTALYATLARVRNRDGAAITLGGARAGVGDFSSTGYDLGIRHSF